MSLDALIQDTISSDDMPKGLATLAVELQADLERLYDYVRAAEAMRLLLNRHLEPGPARALALRRTLNDFDPTISEEDFLQELLRNGLQIQSL